MPLNLDVGGFTAGVKHTATLRLQSPDSLDVEATGDGAKTVLDLVKEAVAELGSTVLPDPVPAEWAELARVPANGVSVILSVGILVKHNDA